MSYLKAVKDMVPLGGVWTYLQTTKKNYIIILVHSFKKGKKKQKKSSQDCWTVSQRI